MQQPSLIAPQSTFLTLFLAFTVVIAVVFVWIGLSTRLPASVDVKRAYGIRRVFFIVGTTAAVVLLVATVPLARMPGPVPGPTGWSMWPRASSTSCSRTSRSQCCGPRAGAADREPGGGRRHAGGVSRDEPGRYPRLCPLWAERQIIAQTQAMPGYFNRLLVRFDEPAQYKVFCLEYCAAGHHLMQAQVAVNQQERIGP